MAKILTDLALRLYAQTSELKKGLSEATSSVKKFNSDTGAASKSASKSFGDLQKNAVGGLSQMTGGLGAFGNQIPAAVGGFKSLAGGATMLNAALGPVGIIIAAIALVIKALASYFKGSVDGAEKFASIMGFIKGILAGLEDIFIKLGRGIVKAFEDPKQAIADLWEAIKQNLVNRFQGLLEFFESAFSALKNGFKALGNAVAGVFDKDKRAVAEKYFKEMQQDLIDTGKAAFKMTTGLDAEKVIAAVGAELEEVRKKAKILQEIEQATFKLRLKSIETARFESNARREVADLMLKTRDFESTSNEERKKALDDLKKIEGEIANRRLADAAEAVKLKKLGNDSTESSVEDLEELQKLEAAYNEVLKTRDDKLREITNQQNEFRESTKKYIEAGIIGWEKMSRVEAEAAYSAYVDQKKLIDQAAKEKQDMQKKAEESYANYLLDKQKETIQGQKDALKQQLDEGLILYQEYAARIKDIDDDVAKNRKEKNQESFDNIISSSSSGIDQLITGWKTYFDAIKTGTVEVGTSLNELIVNSAEAIQGVTDSLLGALSGMFEASKNKELAAAGDNAKKREEIEKKYAQKQKKIAIAQAIINGALAIVKGFAQLGPIGGAITAVLTAATTAAQIAVISSQSFAKGGLVYGPTLGLVGEYPNARSNPEVIAPLDKLENILSKQNGQVIFKIEYDQLIGVLENGTQVKSAF